MEKGLAHIWSSKILLKKMVRNGDGITNMYLQGGQHSRLGIGLVASVGEGISLVLIVYFITFHFFIQVQLMDFFDNREKLKAEFGEYYEKSLKKKWGPGTPETTTNTTYQ